MNLIDIETLIEVLKNITLTKESEIGKFNPPHLPLTLTHRYFNRKRKRDPFSIAKTKMNF